ncbi:MAG: Nif3-like dinuclear metal center hexameric protein [Spirochaetes bacterium]|nr:Nif3-like dinuclear metal center hexameric protein [Spirochaetota bacterium]
MHIREIDRFFHELLRIDNFKKADRGINGLQVANKSKTVSKIAFAVDASLEAFKRAASWGADMLFVHHGILWGGEKAITGEYFDRISFLIENNIALYGVHLPLDADPELGNNISIARKAGLEEIELFGEYGGLKIGYKGVLQKPMGCDEILASLGFKTDEVLAVLGFGPEKCRKVAVIAGGASKEVQQAIDEDIDLYITGEVAHHMYHQCLEAGINVISGGHYLTETFGVKNVAKVVNEKLSLETCFIDVPTRL